MFAVRGVNGEVFRGPFEQLVRAHRVEPLGPTRAVEQDAGETPPLVLPALHDDKRHQAAAAAYASAEHAAPDRGPVYHAYQVMSPRVLAVPPDTAVVAAWRALAARGVGQAPVVTWNGAIVGLVTRANLLQVINEEDGYLRDVLARTVAEVMTTPVVTVDPNADVRRIARVMLEYHLPALPVVVPDTGVLAGIVSRSDILRCVVTDPPLTLWA
jgi:acetoin utilization protein AcuB